MQNRYTSGRPIVTTVSSIALIVIVALASYAYYSASVSRRTVTSNQIQDARDDNTTRLREIELPFWRDISNNPHPSFKTSIRSSLESLEIQIHSVEYNWPTGPTVVSFQGTEKDSYEIYNALRSKGLPSGGYITTK